MLRFRALILRSLAAVALLAVGAIGCGRTGLEGLASPAPKDAGANGDAAAGCADAPRTPRELTSFDGDLREPNAIAILGGFVYVGVELQGGNPIPGAIFRAPLGGGPATELPQAVTGGYVTGPLVTDGARLFYRRYTAPQPGSLAALEVNAYDPQTSTVSVLPEPPGPEQAYVLDLRATSKGPSWLRGAGGGGVHLVTWTGGAPSELTSSPEWLFALALGDADAFLLGNRALVRVALAGGAQQPLPVTLGAKPHLLGARGGRVFLTPDEASIVAVDGASGVATTLVTGVTVAPCGYCQDAAAFVDDAWIYFDDWRNAPTIPLRRVPITGGAPETVMDAPASFAVAITTDACSVYWVTPDIDARRIRVMTVAK